jgi:Uncharacterized protein conserved in bacteria (DUF2188)
MARKVYYVVLHDSEWKVKHDDRHIGVYLTQKAAIKGAVDLAHKDGKSGHDAEVLVQGADHKFRTEWTYGHDPYPPPG